MRRSLGVALFALLLTAAAPADDRRAPTIVAVVRAEHAFAEDSETRGVREAFLAHLAPDGVVFRPTPMPGRAFYESRPAPPGILSWDPEFAEGARSGDLGWTTGRWEFHASATDSTGAVGHYVTVWKRQPDGTWKFAIDAGHAHAAPPASPDHVGTPAVPGFARHGTAPAREAKKLMELDRRLARKGTLAGQAEALLADATDDVRVMREGTLPAIGRPDARALLAASQGGVSVRPFGADVSTAGDLGYSYGLVLVSRDGAATDSSGYLRLWRRARNGRWNVMLDLDVPVRRPRS